MEKIRKHIGTRIVMDIILELNTNIFHNLEISERDPEESLCLKFNSLRNSVQSHILYNVQDPINPRNINEIRNFE